MRRIAWEVSDDAGSVGALLALSECASALERPVDAAHYLGVIKGVTTQPGAPDRVESMTTQVREILGDQAFAAAVGHGERAGLGWLFAG